MRNLICAVLAVFILAGCTPPSVILRTGEVRAPGVSEKYGKVIGEIERLTRRTMSRERIPGLSIALVDSHGPIWEAGFGFADDARKGPVDGNTMFSIQSMSKTLTAIGVLTAVRDGILDLDAPIDGYLPGFRIQSIFEERPQERITLRHLLTHTAGFTHEAPVGNNNDPGQPTFEEHVASIQDTWLMCRVGERYQYSNLGIDLAGFILQKASRRPFSDHISEEVLAPLDMSRTTLDPDIIRAEPNRAIGHQPGCDSIPIIVPMTAAGGVYSSAHDVGMLLSFMLRRGSPGGQILPESLFVEMETTPNYGGYGLGVAMGRRGRDLYMNHGGGGYGFETYMAWYPTLDIGIAVLTNSSAHQSAHLRLADRVIDNLEEAGLVAARYPLTYLPVCSIELGRVKDNGWYFDAHPERTAWKPGWERCLGRYMLEFNVVPRWTARVALAFGFPRAAFVKVSRTRGGMCIDGAPLVEQEPGLFFSKEGEALDFRTDPPTWRNITLRRR